MLNECTAAFGNFDNKRLLVKNRDKTYEPNIEVRHEIIDGTEVLYYQDVDIKHLEGLNEHGIGIIYTTTNFQEKDEADRFTDNIDIIKKALTFKSASEILPTVAKMNGGVKGILIISTPDGTFQVENKADAGPEKVADKLVQPNGWHVVTNIPSMLEAGIDASSGENYICCKIRQAVAEASLFGIEDLDKALESLSYRYFDDSSHHNVLRDSEFEQTVMQVGMDLNANKLFLTKVPKKVKSLKHVNSLPQGYKPKCEYIERKFVEPTLAPFKLFTTNIDESIQRFNLVNYLTGDGPECDIGDLDDRYAKEIKGLDNIEAAQKAAEELWEKERILVSLIRKLNKDPIFFTAGHTSSQVKNEIQALESMIKKINSDYEALLDIIHVERYGEPMVKVESNRRKPRKKGQRRGSPNHSDLYTDENPRGTIKGLKFATVKDAEKSVNKIKRSGRKHAHKIQAAVAMEQRAKAAGKKSASGVYRAYINSMKKKKNESFIREYVRKIILESREPNLIEEKFGIGVNKEELKTLADVETVGDLKALIDAAIQIKKGSNIKGAAVAGVGEAVIDELLGKLPGASLAKGLFGVAKAAYSLPDNVDVGPGLKALDVDDEVSKIVDDKVENAFLLAMQKDLESMANSDPNRPLSDFNMSDALSKYLGQEFKQRTVSGYEK